MAETGPTLHLVEGGSGPVLVCVHGVAGSQRIFDLLAPMLEPSYRVVRVDLLGYGASPKPSTGYGPLEHVEAVRAALTQAGVEGPYVLLGLSMGADLVLEWARRHPDEVRALVALGFPYYPDEAAARVGLRNNLWTSLTIEHPILARLVIPPLWALGRHASGVASRLSSIYTPEMARDALACRYLAFRRTMAACLLHYRPDAALAASGNLARLFVHGSEDRWAPAGAVAEAIAPYDRSELVVLEGADHNVAVVSPRPTAAAITAFLGRALG